MYSYKDFSILVHTTMRTLRFYESKHLLIPTIVNNQKFLTDDDLLKFQLIQLLKDASFSLENIKSIINDSSFQEQIILQKELLYTQLIKIQSAIDLIEQLEKQNDMSGLQLCESFQKIKNTRSLSLQFNTIERLKYRVEFHHRYTKFDDNFQQWMFNHYQFNKNDQVLEIGCGTGDLWLENLPKIPQNIEITMTDISYNMVNSCFNSLKKYEMFKNFLIADCYCLPFDDESFDVVIINHVLMYLEDVSLALKEIHRVLKKGGKIYCSTIAKDMMKERDELLFKFDSKISYKQNQLYQKFGFENGKVQLEKYFSNLIKDERIEKYQIDNVDDYYHFILSANGLGEHLSQLYKKRIQFKMFLEEEYQKHHVFLLTVHAGMFEAKKER